MTPSYSCLLLALPLLCICTGFCNATNIILESFPEHVVTTDKTVETTFHCWTIHDANPDRLRLRFKLNGISLVDDSLIRTTAGQCDQGLVPDGQHCENITARIPGDISLDQTTLMCSLFGLERLFEQLNVTIIINDPTIATPDCTGTSDTEPMPNPTTSTPHSTSTSDTEPTPNPTTSTPHSTSTSDTEPTPTTTPTTDTSMEGDPMLSTDTAFDFKTAFTVTASALILSILLNIVLAVALACCWKSSKASRKAQSPNPENPDQP